MAYKKSTNAEIQQRVAAVYELLIKGYSRAAIVRNFAKTWGCKSRVIDIYIQRATAQIKDDAEKIKQNALEEMLVRHSDLRKRAYAGGDLRLILDADNFDAKLLGLFKVKPSSMIQIDFSQLTDDQLDRIAAGEDPLDVLRTSSGAS